MNFNMFEIFGTKVNKRLDMNKVFGTFASDSEPSYPLARTVGTSIERFFG